MENEPVSSWSWHVVSYLTGTKDHTKHFKNIPPEALPAYENDQNYCVLTARSQFLHSKPLQKKVHLLWEWQPFHDFSLKKGNRNFFSHFLQHVSGGFHQVFPCALPPPLERAHAFPYLRIANISQSNTRHPEPIHLTRREAHSEGSENMKEKNVNVFMSACICQRDVYDV